jgi:hypothetical protein
VIIKKGVVFSFRDDFPALAQQDFILEVPLTALCFDALM